MPALHGARYGAVMDLGRVGLWTFYLDQLPATAAQEAAVELEELGYGAVWVPETVAREAMTNAGMLLAGTSRLVVATGIASIWARTAPATAAARATLDEAYPGRFVLGLGVSHQPMVEGVHHQTYTRPRSAMASYLQAMDEALVLVPPPSRPGRRVLAALGPRMLALAAEATDGAHPYNATPEHTAEARQILGPGKLLCPEQAVVLDGDPTSARAAARAHLSLYLGLPNYAGNWRRLGFGEDDLTGGGSDRLVDAIVAWGDLDALAARVRAHLDAGADHVAVQVVMPALTDDPRAVWRELAPALLA